MEIAQCVQMLLMITEKNAFKVLSVVDEEGKTINDIASATQLPIKEVFGQVGKLKSLGILENNNDVYTSRMEQVREEIKELRKIHGKPISKSGNEEERFYKDGKIINWPAKMTLKEKLLNLIIELFQAERNYTEGEVNVILKEVCQDPTKMDHCTLRRYLVDYRLLARENGIYRKTGEKIPVE